MRRCAIFSSLMCLAPSATARDCGQEELHARDISGCITLTHVKHIGHKGLVWLGDALHHNAALETVDLHHTKIGDEDAISFAQGLRNNHNLRVLAMHNNRIGDAGAAALGAALANNSALNFLSMSSNAIGDEGAVALAEGLKKNRGLRRLDLYVNKVGDKGAQALAAALEVNRGLRMLHLDTNRIEDAGAKAIADVLRRDDCPVDCLTIMYNQIRNEGAAALIDAARKTPRVHTMKVAHNQMVHGDVYDDEKRLAKELKTRQEVKDFLVSSGLTGAWNSSDPPALHSPLAPAVLALNAHNRFGWDALEGATEESLRGHAGLAALTEPQRERVISAVLQKLKARAELKRKKGMKDEV